MTEVDCVKEHIRSLTNLTTEYTLKLKLLKWNMFFEQLRL